MTPFNEHIRLAQAMLHGHLYIDPAPPWMEHITIGGHDYILHPPLSAIVCLPFVAIGITDQTHICELLALASIALTWKLTHELWLVTFFALGTTVLYEATNGASWDFALICSLPFTLSAIILTREGRGGAWVGFFAGLASLARYDLMLAWPVYFWIHRRNNNEKNARNDHGFFNSIVDHNGSFMVGILPTIIIYTWFNEARFGTLTDGSVSEWYWHYDTFRAQRPYGPFSVYYIPFNLYTLLFMSPAFVGVFPWIKAQFMGQALLSLSPAFATAKFGPWLMAATLTSLPALTVYASGFSQLGCRYYVQVFPFLIASMIPARSAADRTEKTTTSMKVLVMVSIVSSQYFTIVARTYGLN